MASLILILGATPRHDILVEGDAKLSLKTKTKGCSIHLQYCAHDYDVSKTYQNQALVLKSSLSEKNVIMMFTLHTY